MYNPREPFFLQWHITDRCDLNCRHCYRDQLVSDLPLTQLRRIFENFLQFRRCLPQPKARVQIAGGEPLLRGELYELLALIVGAGLQVRILSNGLLIDAEAAAKLKAHGCAIVQLSLEGAQTTHDAIRGQGTFERAVRAAELLRQRGVQVTFAMTLSRLNISDIPAVLELALRHAERIGFHRLVPCGRGRDLAEEMLSAEELNAAFEVIWNFKQTHPQLEIPLRDPLWKPFIRCASAEQCVDGCSVGYAGLCLNANGDVLPCRRLPIVIGNALTDRLEDLWNGPILQQLRDRDLLTGRCGSCVLRWRCGGCRAIPHALSGQRLAEDPQCFYKPSMVERLLRRAAAYASQKVAGERLDGG